VLRHRTEPTCNGAFKGFSRIVSGACALLAALLMPIVATPADIDWYETIGLIRSKFPDVEHLSTARLAELLSTSAQGEIVLLDVRELDEYQVGHLSGAVLATDVEMALEAFGDRVRHETIVVHCAVGYRFSRLATKLESRGYDSVFNLEGSLFKWANEGRPMHRDTTCVEEVHPYDDEWGQLLAPRYRSEPD